MTLKRLTNIIAALAPVLVMAFAVEAEGQRIDIRIEGSLLIDIDTISTHQVWLSESPDLKSWTRRSFIDAAATIDMGHPASDRHFYRLEELYRAITWAGMPDMPTARDQFTGGVIDGKVYVFGGNGIPNGVDLRTLDIYDIATDQWTQGTSYDFGLEELSSAVAGGKLYVFGGWAGRSINTTLCYDPEHDKWNEKAPKLTHLEQATAVAWGDDILLLGGNLPGSDEVSATVQAYNTVANEWRLVTDIPEPLWAFAAGIHDNVLYLVGGFSGGSVHPEDLIPHNKVHRFDLINGIWLPDIVGILPRPVGFGYSSACPVVNGHMIIAGGGTTIDGAFTISDWQTDLVISNNVLAYDSEDNSFVDNAPLADTFGNHLVLLAEDRLFVCGGNAGPDTFDDLPTARIYIGSFNE